MFSLGVAEGEAMPESEASANGETDELILGFDEVVSELVMICVALLSSPPVFELVLSLVRKVCLEGRLWIPGVVKKAAVSARVVAPRLVFSPVPILLRVPVRS